jgi:hypothetical protein
MQIIPLAPSPRAIEAGRRKYIMEVIYFAVLGIELMPSHMLDKCALTPHPSQSW